MSKRLEVTKLKKWLMNFYTTNQICDFCNVNSSTLACYLNGSRNMAKETEDNLLSKLKEMKDFVMKGAR